MRFNALIPELSVTDLAKSLHFYTEILGFKKEYERLPDKFCFLALGEAQLMLEQRNGAWETAALEYPLGRGINFQIEVNNLGILLERLKEYGFPLFREAREEWYQVDRKLEGQREFLVQDPDGYLLRFCESLGTKENN